MTMYYNFYNLIYFSDMCESLYSCDKESVCYEIYYKCTFLKFWLLNVHVLWKTNKIMTLKTTK